MSEPVTVNPLIVNIFLITFTALFTALITFFVKTLAGRKQAEECAIKMVTQHEAVHHQGNMIEIAKNQVQEHKDSCIAPAHISKMMTDIAWIVTKLGGDPRE